MSDVRVDLRHKLNGLTRRRKRVRKMIMRSGPRPRLVVYRSNRHIYAQVVDPGGQTIAGCSSLTPALREKVAAAATKVDEAKLVGEYLAGLAKEKGISRVTFDRNGRKYHGRVKSLAEGARAGGLEF